MNKIFLVVAMMAFVLSGFVFGASSVSSSGTVTTQIPAIQVTSTSTVPSVLYPDSSAQLKLTVTNTGDDMATNVQVFRYNTQSSYDSINLGDLPVGASTVATIPIKVPSDLKTGIYLAQFELFYRSSDGSFSRQVPITIPLEISQHPVLEIKTNSLSRNTISPGDRVIVNLEVFNTGGIMNNVVITTEDNSSFSIDGSSQVRVGNILQNETKNVSVSLVTSSSVETGKYSIPLLVSYADPLQNTIQQKVTVGPVTVADSSSSFKISVEEMTVPEIGSVATLRVYIQNLGTSEITPVIDIGQSDNFIPIGASMYNFDIIKPGQKGFQDLKIGINAGLAAGPYNLPVTINLNGKSYSQNIGIYVKATPEIIVSSEVQTSSGSPVVSLQISNIGNAPIRSLYVKATSTDAVKVVGTADKFLGTLNIDDFSTFQFTVSTTRNSAGAALEIPVTITYKDSVNQEHTIEESVLLTIGSGGMAFNTTAGAFGSQSGAAGLRTGRAAQGRLFGFDYMIIGIAVVGLIAIFFGYRWWAKKKKKKQES